MKDSDLAFLTKLENIITERCTSPVDSSYTSSLFAAGTKRIAQKVGEEAVEVALASAMGDRSETIDEAADLIYHLLVLLASQEIALSEVVAKLQSRHKA